MAKAHAVLSASGAHRWLECTPSARLETKFPNKSSAYAEEGTVAHELAEVCALQATNQISTTTYNERLFEIKKSMWYNEEMLECCSAYADLIKSKWKELRQRHGGAEVLIEAKIDFDKWVPMGFGTADCIILADSQMEVIDFKYGKGKRVEAFENPQMRLYTLGAYNSFGMVYEVEHITMTIFQPRIANGVSSDEITINGLLDWAESYVKPRAKLAYAGKGNFNPSEETCRFCKAKATCKARAEKNLELYDDGFDARLLTVQEAGQLLEKASDIEAWLSDLKEYVQSALFEGAEVPGWKLVAGRSVRRFSDEHAVVEALLGAGYDPAVIYKAPELITLTQMEKDFGKKAVEKTIGHLIVKPAGKPTLAPESDRRPAIKREEELLKEFDDYFKED